MVWCGSTEVYLTESAGPRDDRGVREGPRGERRDDPVEHDLRLRGDQGRHPYANAAPNLSADIPALIQLAQQTGSPMCGKDLKTGQTLIKTIIAPGLKARLIGVEGWYSTNILGNRDGEVLDDPESFKTKEESKKSVLDYILQPNLYPELYKNLCHVVRINYYPPRGDNKEGWDNIDIFGWLGYPMQLKINFLCRDSILAAPIVLDSALFLDLAKRAGMSGIQEWLSFYYKSPMHAAGAVSRARPVHPVDEAQEHAAVSSRAKSSSRISVGSTTTDGIQHPQAATGVVRRPVHRGAVGAAAHQHRQLLLPVGDRRRGARGLSDAAEPPVPDRRRRRRAGRPAGRR